jgi:hypothetical protein
MNLITPAFLLIFALGAPPASNAAPVCVLGMVPCFLACGSPPRLKDTNEAALWLRQTEYEGLSRFDEISALVTTQFGKCIGINGWKRYRFRVWAVGTVDQAATSWDGLRTTDLVLENFNDHTRDQLLPRPRYIRAEIIRRVWKHLEHPPCHGDHIRVEGELHWDGHGFLEIHPSQVTDVQFVSVSTNSKDCTKSK